MNRTCSGGAWRLVRLCLAAAAAAGGASALVAQPTPPSSTAPTAVAEAAPAAQRAAAGALSGYVASASCRPCHLARYESYREVGMSRSFFRPTADRDIETLLPPAPSGSPGEAPRAALRHAPSGESYAMSRERTPDGERLVFRQWQEGAHGERRNLLEIPVDWVLGSGHHARTYLYQVASGELYQLPIAWYSQDAAWGMAPGYDRPDHPGVHRGVERECLFCHAAYPNLPPGADQYGLPAAVAVDLSEGTGCQRCHGPGARHVALAQDPEASAETIRAAIVQPAKLPAARRDDICNQCHFQPAVALPGVRRFGRGDFSYRPGEALSDYLAQVDVQQEGEPPRSDLPISAGSQASAPAGSGTADRFEINHHSYRLRQSRCFEASAGALACITCHDPHRRIPEADRVAHYRRACLTCHTDESCSRPVKHVGLAPAPSAGHGADSGAGGPAPRDSGNCAGCHMPRRRTEDVVHVVMTDHRIARDMGGSDLVAPRAERDPVLLDAWLLDPASVGTDDELYRATAVVRTGASPDALRQLDRLLQARKPTSYEPVLDLGRGWLERGEPKRAEAIFATLLEHFPAATTPARAWQAMAIAQQGRIDEAIAAFEAALVENPAQPEALVNLARLKLRRGSLSVAESLAQAALALRPNQVLAWLTLGDIAQARGEAADAEKAFRTAIKWAPREAAGYARLIALLQSVNRPAEAAQWQAWSPAAPAE